jgi:flavin-dependent dehydrogenase
MPEITGEIINIIGAGPAGLTAAIVLRRLGCRVRVFDKFPDVGYRLNGDFQGLENWSSERDITEILKDIGIRINFLCSPCFGGTVYTRGTEPVKVKSDRPIFYLVKRGPNANTLDTGLKEQALSLGVEIIFNRRLNAVDGNTIIATGPRMAVGIISGITFKTSKDDMVAVVFNDDIAPKGYAYLVINQGEGTMVTVLYREFRDIGEYFQRMVRFFTKNIDIDIRDEKRFGGYGDFFIPDTLKKDERICVGESGGLQDYLWGFGMRYAFVSGYLAARSLIDGTDYDSLWKRDLRPMMETSLVNRYLYEKFGQGAYKYISKKVSGGNPCNFLRRQYNPSLLKQLLLPVAMRNYKKRFRSSNDLHARVLHGEKGS